ncbi:hypothetical protein ACEWY4_000071 [Coilia grayii]|uniref:Transmembrane protein 51 n=1 Tax=Coilia grayii TaxID=363190 RepID=A0ABD1KWV0_9TELE
MSQSTVESGGGGGGVARASVSNSGSQYALCALGVGLVALGVVMIVWSVVPAEGQSGRPGLSEQGRTSSVAFVLVGTGVTMLLLSLCLSIRNKRRRSHTAQQGGANAYNTQLSVEDSVDVLEEGFAVPSYDEVVGSGGIAPPVATQDGRSNSASQLPSYEDVLEGGQAAVDGPPLASEPQPSAAVPTAATGGRWKAGAARKLLPLKIRRIKSEKLGVKSAPSSPQPVVFSIEPLTPPPQYEDKPPQL